MRLVEILTIRIKPLTPLVFKTMRPFLIGGYATTNIMPMPSTIAGMLKTALMEELGFNNAEEAFKERKDLFGTINNPNEHEWILIGPYFHNSSINITYYPKPMDLLYCGESNAYLVARIDLAKELSRVEYGDENRLGLCTFYVDNDELIELESVGALVSHEIILKYLSDNSSKSGYKIKAREISSIPEILSTEDIYEKILRKKAMAGIDLDKKTKQVVYRGGKGHFYSVEKLYFSNQWGFLIGIIPLRDNLIDDFQKLDGKIVRLGGEGGLVRLVVRVGKNSYPLVERNLRLDETYDENTVLKLIVTSPTPIMEDTSGDTYDVPLIKDLKVIGFHIRRTMIGGWDYLRNLPKETHYAVAPGSIYYIKPKQKINSLDIIVNRSFVNKRYKSIFGSCLLSKVM